MYVKSVVPKQFSTRVSFFKMTVYWGCTWVYEIFKKYRNKYPVYSYLFTSNDNQKKDNIRLSITFFVVVFTVNHGDIYARDGLPACFPSHCSCSASHMVAGKPFIGLLFLPSFSCGSRESSSRSRERTNCTCTSST